MSKTDILKAALFTPISKGRWGLPLIAWSNPGEAKTSIIEELCAEYGLPCIVLSPGEMGEGAFGVIPVPDKGKDGQMVIRYPAPEWTLDVADGGVVFIDEMSSTPPALQPPLLGLLFARRIGGATLGPLCRVIGAANPPAVAAGGFDLAPPVANRCGHIQWKAPDVAEHAAYMMRAQTSDRSETTRSFNPRIEEKRVLDAWPEAWAWAVGLETSFLHRRQSLKNNCPPAGDPGRSLAWPSDRSWENATRALASARVHGLSDSSRDEFVSSFVGAGVANEFFQFIAEQDLPDPADVLDGTAKFVHTRTRLDRTAAVINSCSALVAPTSAKKRDARAKALWDLMTELTSTDKTLMDVLVPSTTALVKAGLHTKGGVPLLAKMNPLLKAAGVRADG